MKKGLRLLKRMAALFLVLLLSIESFGAVVSDNDGSAFITKAEFDSLKNDFQAQIDQYNTSIDSKIDGAIAAYLAGIKVDAETITTVPFASWKKVTTLNYIPESTYKPISLDGSYQADGYGNVTGTGQGWYQTYYVTANVKSTRSRTSNYQVVNVVDAGTESDTMPTYVTWIGRAKNYYDKLTVSLQWRKSWTGGSSSKNVGTTVNYLSGTSNGNFSVTYWARFGTGYWKDLSDNAQNIWKPDVYYSNSTSSYNGYLNASTNISKSATTSVEILAVDNEYYDYEHIITWGNLSGYRVCDPDWLNTLQASPEAKGTDMNRSSSSGYWGGTETNNSDSGNTKQQTSLSNYYKGAYNSNTQDTATPLVGLLSSSYTADKIYQNATNFSQLVDKTTFTSDKVILTDGFQLLAAKKGDKITWKPVFTAKVNNADYSGKIFLRLAVGPLAYWSSAKDSNTTIINDINTGKNYFTISNLSETIQWEMPEDGIVYAKWRPEPDTANNFEITLDLEQCGEYKRVKAN